ncbi:hypothetical protein [Aeromicrobium sp. CTD01-1L150]|uniref:hypothetical protein n=1 Tax=Aeromicrobium sp. CTD01-1L150 TaxID=3341830 RepID=UPI0035C26DB4
MPSDVVLLAVTAVLAVVAVVAAVVATRASRQVVRARQDSRVLAVCEPRDESAPREPVASVTSVPERPAELAPRVVEGRVVVPPTREEVVSTALSRPQVRLAVLVHGLVTALRPESRDRIAALMRREYRDRRRYRLRAGRRASRAAHLAPTSAGDRWLGELPQTAADDSNGRAIDA